MSLSKELVFLLLQFCDEENLKRTAHMLEQETGYFFDLKYFEELVLQGDWDEAENYLSSFTAVEDNKYSIKIYFEIRKQKLLEALDKHEPAVALDILLKDLKVFAESNKELYKEMTQLLTLDDFREHNSLASYGDTLSARKKTINEIRPILEANPLLRGRTRFPQINKSRLRRLINQSLNWQHLHCSHPHPQPHIDTLFTDHICPGPDNMQDQFYMESSFAPIPMADHSSITESIMTGPAVNVGNPNNEALGGGYNIDLIAAALGDSKNSPDASKLMTSIDEVAPSNEFSDRCQDSANEVPSEFPVILERTLNMSSSSTAMDFHPVQETLLLVGNNAGAIELWDVTSVEKLFERDFVVWEAKPISGQLLEDMTRSPGISVTRVLWSDDGYLFGVAHSKHMVHLYCYDKNGNYLLKKLEIDAHAGNVNDLAFSRLHSKYMLISCGDDKLIQVWDTESGAKKYTFEGHEASVRSLCPHVKENVNFIFSNSLSGEIKAWLFDNEGPRFTYDAPGFCSMRMVYSTDGKRLFSCGTNKNGEPHMVEWNESEGSIIRSYQGLHKCSSETVQFGTCLNQYLAAGDDYFIKIWNMDNADLLAVIDAEGGLPERPYICFNKKGNLLAATANGNQIKILANDDGHELLKTSCFVYGDSSGCLTESFRKLSVNPVPAPLKDKGGASTGEPVDMLVNVKLKGPAVEMPNISKIVEVSRCQYLLLPSEVKTNLIRRLVYTHAGNGILALAEDGTHLLWRWTKCKTNLSGQATTKWQPQLWQPKSGLLMINDLPVNSLDVVSPCLSLSKNDSYVISASGRMINLYNMLAFKKMRSVMMPPPAATCILFYPPDNNIMAIGMDDSTILIYHIRVDRVISKLQGHSRRISGLAFSPILNVLVSCGVDTQIVVWDSVTWEKKKSTMLQISVGWLASSLSETTIELDKNQTHFLAVHETQLAIYETASLRRMKQWTIANFCTRISHAAYSCDSQLVYAAMRDGILLILGASDLAPRFEIDPSAYLPPRLSSFVDPIVVAAHPQKPYQFALGLSNGGVVVVEPLESQGSKWASFDQAQMENESDLNY